MSRLAAVLCVASGALPALALKLKMELEANGGMKPTVSHLDELEEKFDGELEEKHQGHLEEKFEGEGETPRGDRSETRVSDSAAGVGC